MRIKKIIHLIMTKTNLQCVVILRINSIPTIKCLHTFGTTVNLGFRDANPPRGSRGDPLTNCRNARLCSSLNSCIISSN